MHKTILYALSLSGLLSVSMSLFAGPTLYPQPLTPRFEEGDEQLTCNELNLQIDKLSPQTYSSKPNFYDDPYHGASIWGGAIWAPGAWSYMAYSGVAEYTEYDRVQDAQNRIEALRYLKARRRCHE
jgi:hypothetical protein